jgi:HSP20 family protein
MLINKSHRPMPAVKRFRTVNDLISDLFDDVSLPIAGKLEHPYVNIHEDQNAFHIELIAPGFSKDQFNVSIHEGTLQVKGEVKSSDATQDRICTRKEYVLRSFERSFALPESVNLEDVKANYENGILKLSLPKSVEAKADTRKQITIN